MPVLVAVILSWAATMNRTVMTDDKYIACENKATRLYAAFLYTNAGLTYIPTVIITVILNTAIIVRLKRSVNFKVPTSKFNRRQKKINSFRDTSLSSSSAREARGRLEELSACLINKRSHIIRQSATIRRKNNIR